MSKTNDQSLLDALLDSWDKNNTILLNLLRVMPDGGLETRAVADGPSVSEMFTHMHYARVVLVSEDTPEFAGDLPQQEWMNERDPDRIAQLLGESAKLVNDAVRSRVESKRDMDRHYDHPILMLQHLIWHEGYHHGQIKLALKLSGRSIPDKDAGPETWWVWMRKTGSKTPYED